MSTRLIKKPLFLIPLIMAAAISLVSILAWVALRPINEKTGFSRKFITNKLQQLNVIDKPKDVVDFAGNTDHHIYFKTIDPAKIYVTDNQLRDGHYITLKVPNNPKIASRFNCIVDSPTVYILAGNLPGIIRTQPGNTFSIYQFPGALFTRTALISKNSFALRMFDHVDQVFVKGNPSTGELIKENNISEKNKDAGISTDGILVYDKESSSLFYTYYYRNEILCLDTNLHLIKKIKTIDINSSYLAKAEEVKSQNIITSLTPKRLLNALSSVNKGYLFNNSRIKGDGETHDIFMHNSVIDVYNIKDGSFKSSFYIPAYKKEKINSFRVMNNMIITVCKNYLISYKLPEINH
jgi:hypothetical protein